jgi:serine/threonine-protein kinase
MLKKLLPFVFFGLLIVAAYLSFDWAIGAVIHSRKVVLVPDLSGKSVNDALNILGPLGLGLEKEGEQFDKRFPAGTIVQQTPVAAMSVREGRIVRVTVSQGGETLFVPNLVGQPMRNTQTSLQNLGLNVGEIDHRPSLKFEKDQVMATDPPAGATVVKNGLVNLVLSDGPPAADVVLMPDFTGRSLDKAKEWAAEHQMPVSMREDSDISRPNEEILTQSPVGDSPIRAGDTLTLVVNNPGANNPTQGPRIYYEVPQGSSDRDIRITVMDETGEKEVFRHSQTPGSKVELHVQPKGHARARIFVNGVMVEEQPLQ